MPPGEVVSQEAPEEEAFVEEAARQNWPIPLFDEWEPIDQTKYPYASAAAGEEGDVGYSVKVDENGEATDCKVSEPSGYPALDQATCPMVMRSVAFQPQLDAKGKAIRSTYRGDWHWRLRKPELSETEVEVRYHITAEGNLQDCRVVKAEGAVPKGVTLRPCPRSHTIVPYRDEQGRPVARDVTLKMIVEVTEPSPEAAN